MKHLKTYEGLFDFLKKKPKSSFDMIGTSHDLLLDFIDDNKVELVKQGKEYIQFHLTTNSSGWYTIEQDRKEIRKSIEPILKEWNIRYYFHHVYLYIISDEFYNEVYKIFKGLRKAKFVNNSYQYLLVKRMTNFFYIYVDGEDMKIASNIVNYLCNKYNIEYSALYSIIEEIVPPMYELEYMTVRSIGDSNKQIFNYYQPEFK